MCRRSMIWFGWNNMAPRIMRFDNISRRPGVPGIPSEEEENALTNAAFEAFQGARQIEIRPSGTDLNLDRKSTRLNSSH